MTILDNGVRVAVPESTYVDGRAISQNTAGFIITAEYTNYMQTTLYLKTQANVPFALEPNTLVVSSENPHPHLEIKLSYRLQTNAGVTGTANLLTTLIENKHILSEDAQELHRQMTEMYRHDGSRNNKTNFTFTVFRRIREEDFKKTRMIYFRESDMILTREKESLTLPHPNSSTGMQHTEIRNAKEYSGQTGVFVKVVDNQCLAEVRYYYAGKRLIAVPSTADSERESGVYCTIASQASDGSVEPDTSFMTFKEAEVAIGLFKFKEDAESYGNPELILKNEEVKHRSDERKAELELRKFKQTNDARALEQESELAALRHAVELQKAENVALKESADFRKTLRDDTADTHKVKRAKSEAEIKYKKLKKEVRLEAARKEREAEQKEREARLDEERKLRENYYDQRKETRKDWYEDRSYQRKDTSELIKFIPALVLGVVGTLAVINARSSH